MCVWIDVVRGLIWNKDLWEPQPQGGTTIGRWYGFYAVVMIPFFQASLRSLAYQFSINAPLMCPKIFAPMTPHFSRKTRSLDPTFGNLHGTFPPKKVECPPPPRAPTTFIVLNRVIGNAQNVVNFPYLFSFCNPWQPFILVTIHISIQFHLTYRLE